MSHTSLVLRIACTTALLAGVAGAQAAEHPASSSRRAIAFFRLTNSDCVIECTIKDVHLTTKRPGVFRYPEDRGAFLVAELAHTTIVRGYGSPRRVRMDWEVANKRWIGQRVILCCYWDPRSNMFAVGRQRIFHRLFDRWAETEQLQGLPPEFRAAFSDAEVDSVVEANSLSSLTRRADVIVVGQVESVSDSALANYHVAFSTLSVERVLKGDRRLGSVSFLSDWYYPHLTVGETWIAFLRREGAGYRPLGGCNGLLKFEGQRVYFDNKVRCPFTRNVYVGVVGLDVRVDRNRQHVN